MAGIGKYQRSVSIIGVGCTPFMQTLANPETVGLTEGELFGYAALEAMQDAGIECTDIDFFFHGQATPFHSSNYISPNIQVADWAGMRGRGSMHHSQACCTGYLALDAAVNAVASGKCNIVLTGAVEFGESLAIPDENGMNRKPFTMEEFLGTLGWLYERSYTRPMVAGRHMVYADSIARYQKEYGTTDEELDEALNMLAVQMRQNSSRHPLALMKETYEETAKKCGYDDVMEYMRSRHNPKITEHLRTSAIEVRAEGAAAAIVCPTEIAHQFKQQPIEVLAIGNGAFESSNAYVEWRGTERAVAQAYEQSGIKPEELELFYANDFCLASDLIAAELAGYLPKGEGWKAMLEGRTALGGDRPINTNGGRTAFGHAHGASGLADHYECVKQMRGQCGDRQVQKLPKTAMLRGFGGSQNLTATILRSVE